MHPFCEGAEFGLAAVECFLNEGLGFCPQPFLHPPKGSAQKGWPMVRSDCS